MIKPKVKNSKHAKCRKFLAVAIFTKPKQVEQVFNY